MARILKDLQYIVFDSETAVNLDTHKQQIIELGWVIITNSKITNRCSFFVYEEKPDRLLIRPKIHVSKSDVAKGQLFSDVLNSFFNDLRGVDVLVGHNIQFDLRLIRSSLEKYELKDEYTDLLGAFRDIPQIDTLKLARYLYPHDTSHKLKDIMAKHRIAEDVPRHSALNDARFTALCMGNMLKTLREKENVITLEGVISLLSEKGRNIES